MYPVIVVLSQASERRFQVPGKPQVVVARCPAETFFIWYTLQTDVVGQVIPLNARIVETLDDLFGIVRAAIADYDQLEPRRIIRQVYVFSQLFRSNHISGPA